MQVELKYCFVSHDEIVSLDAGKTFLAMVQAERVVFLNIKNGAILRVLKYAGWAGDRVDSRIPSVPKHAQLSFKKKIIPPALLGCKLDKLNPTRMLLFSNDKTTSLWSTVTMEFLTRYTGHKSNVNGADFGSRGHTVFSAGEDGMLIKYNCKTGKRMTSTAIDASFLSVACVNFQNYSMGVASNQSASSSENMYSSHDRLVTAANDGTCCIWSCTNNAFVELTKIRINQYEEHGVKYQLGMSSHGICALSSDASIFAVSGEKIPCSLYDSTTVHVTYESNRTSNCIVHEERKNTLKCLSAREAFDQYAQDNSIGGDRAGERILDDIYKPSLDLPVDVGYSLGSLGSLSFDPIMEGSVLSNRVQGHLTHRCTAMSFSDSSKYFVTASTDKKIRIWRCSMSRSSFALAFTINVPHDVKKITLAQSKTCTYMHAVCGRRILVFDILESNAAQKSLNISNVGAQQNKQLSSTSQRRIVKGLTCGIPSRNEDNLLLRSTSIKSTRSKGRSVHGLSKFGRPKREQSMSYVPSPRKIRHSIHLRRMGYKAHHRSSVGVLLRIVNVHHENQWFAEQSRGSIRNGLSAQQRAFEKERTVHLDFMANWLDCSKAKVSEDLSQWNTRPDPTFLLSALVGREGMKVLWDEVEEKNVGSKKIMSEKELENARRQVVKRQ
jgi:WD40 repeat protein